MVHICQRKICERLKPSYIILQDKSWMINNEGVGWIDISDYKICKNSGISLKWRHNGRDGVSNHQPHHCLLNRFFMRRSKKTKLRVTGLCVGNSPVTGEFPTQMASNAENVSIWWRHHVQRSVHHELGYYIINPIYLTETNSVIYT